MGDSTSKKSSGSATSEGSGAGGSSEVSTSGEDSVLGGTVLDVVADLPVDVSGNSVSVIGDSVTTASTGASHSSGSGDEGFVCGVGSDEDEMTSAGTTSGSDSVLGGSIVDLGAALPVTVGGNAVSVIGDSTSTGSSASSSVTGSGSSAGSTSGSDSVLGGTILDLTAALPVTIGGNAVSVIGDSTTTGSHSGGPGGETPGGENPGDETPGEETPDGENPGGETPVGEIPGGENPGGENPGDETAGTPPTAATDDTPGTTDGATVGSVGVVGAGLLTVGRAAGAATVVPTLLAQTGLGLGGLLGGALLLLVLGLAARIAARRTPLVA